jgi:hypothetical protein
MKRKVFRIVILVCSCLFCLAAVSAETFEHQAFSVAGKSTPILDDTATERQPYLLKRGDNEFGIWAGFSPKPTVKLGGLHSYEAENRKYFLTALRYGRTLAANHFLALQYTVDVFPLIAATGVIVDRGDETDVTTFRRNTAFGIGMTPAGIQVDFANGSKFHPFFHVNGGFFVASESMPIENSGGFSLIGEGGAGVRIFSSDRRAVTLGAMLHHISNAGLYINNRGLNQIVFYAGLSIFK